MEYASATNDVDYFEVNRGVFGYDFKTFFDVALVEVGLCKPDLVYIRYPLASIAVLEFVRRVKKYYPKVNILVEKQTLEVKELLSTVSFRNMALILRELALRKCVLSCVDYVICVTREISEYNLKIGAVNVLVMGNGIDGSLIETEVIHQSTDSDIVRLAYVGNLAKWSSLSAFVDYLAVRKFRVDGKNIVLDIVGGGIQEKLYSDLSRKYEAVEYHGYLEGSRLHEVLRSSDYCLGSFGNYKRGLSESSNLKLRLYCALGIPFIYFDYDADFDDDSLRRVAVLLDSDVRQDYLFDLVLERIFDDTDLAARSKLLIEFATKNLTWEAKFTKLFLELNL